MPVKSYPKQNRIHRGHKACHSVVEIETPMQTCETCLLRFILIRLKIQTLPGKAPLKDTEGNFSWSSTLSSEVVLMVSHWLLHGFLPSFASVCFTSAPTESSGWAGGSSGLVPWAPLLSAATKGPTPSLAGPSGAAGAAAGGWRSPAIPTLASPTLASTTLTCPAPLPPGTTGAGGRFHRGTKIGAVESRTPRLSLSCSVCEGGSKPRTWTRRKSPIGNDASRTAEPILSLPTLLIGPVIKRKHKTWLLHTVTTSNYAPLLHLDLGSKQLVPNLRMMKRFKVHAWLFQCVQWLILCKSSCSLVVLAYDLIFFMVWMYIVRQFATTVFQSIPCNRPWTSNLLQIRGYCMLHSPKRLRLPAHVYLHPSPRTIAIALTGAAAGPLEPML